MPSEIRQTEKDKCVLIPCIRSMQHSQIHRDRSRREDSRAGRGAVEAWELLFNGYRVSVWYDEKFWNSGDDHLIP